MYSTCSFYYIRFYFYFFCFLFFFYLFDYFFFFFFFFFFQAEDGIRDGRVTGVQTCALPIYARRQHRALLDDEHLHPRGHLCHGLWRPLDVDRDDPLLHPHRLRRRAVRRSEERRVGKECRSRWSPDH